MSSVLQTPGNIVEIDVTVTEESGVATTTGTVDEADEGDEVTRVLVADGNATVRKILRHNFVALG